MARSQGCPCGHAQKSHVDRKGACHVAGCGCEVWGIGDPDAYSDDGGLSEASIEQTPPEDAPSEPPVTRRRRGRPSKGKRPNATKAERLEATAYDFVAKVSVLTVAFSPTAAAYNAERAEQTVTDLLALCAKHPFIARALAGTGDVMVYASVAQWIGGIVLAVGMDRGLIPPEHIAAKVLGVAEIYAEQHPEEQQREGASAPRSDLFVPPPLLAGAQGFSG